MAKQFGARRFALPRRWLALMFAFLAVGLLGANSVGEASAVTASGDAWRPFEFLRDPSYSPFERCALIFNILVAFAGLTYAYWLVRFVYRADTGTPRMQEITRAIREGADAYLFRQLRVVALLIVAIGAVLVLTKWPWGLSPGSPDYDVNVQIAVGRGAAFLLGSFFSATVGFVGMRLATTGNLRVAAAAKESFGKALQIGYRTGTVTGMLTDGLGLLGGTTIFLYFGEKAFEVLLGFGFGGTLLALFMRVGGGIYTKAADVGADLVGKIEANIPEDDPRNAATIADNVGDNVGDCAGMAADIFESYEVTIVAALILGLASFGHMGVIFPLLVHAVGVIGSIISTSRVKAGETGDVKEAMGAVTKGFWLGAAISVLLIVTIGFFYLDFSADYIVNQGVERGVYQEAAFRQQLGVSDIPGATPADYREPVARAWRALPQERREAMVNNPANVELAQKYVPLRLGRDPRPWLTCLIGIALALSLHRVTDYWTSTEFEPVKSLAKSCRTGHATNIISGLALGYESAVWAVLVIAVALLGSVVVYLGTSPVFIAFGVAMCGIGMLTLTGNIISMDVFGPVADNANGIGEMGYNKDPDGRDLQPGQLGYMAPEDYKRARQTLADLDAVGNTTKAITKGIAIGSAVLAAVSLFASFIAVLSTGTEEGITRLTTQEFYEGAAKLTVANPIVFIGMLIGGAVPFLFSSMTIRAVGRAAYLIVQECRQQFRDPEIWAGTKRPDYGRVVDICTTTAQKELVGPGLLAIFAPVFVGFAMGPYALGGYLAGMIVAGMLLAVFMANAGGAWDNAKKTIEDQPRTALTGKGSEAHKASVTGDTVGDPLKDTAGPAINPLIKVMNMVSLLVLPLVITYNVASPKDVEKFPERRWVGLLVLLVAVAAVGWAWWRSKVESPEMRKMDEEFARAAEAAAAEPPQDRTPVGMH